jgi:transcriptional regulator with XRE-family HTH domain
VPRRTRADPTAQAFGAAVRQVRQNRSETLEEVARRIDRMDAKYLGEIERGWHSPSLSTALRVAQALDVTLASLVQDLG